MMHHIAVSLNYLNRMSDIRLAGMLTEGGEPLAVPAARRRLKELHYQGYDVVPPCDHVDAQGHCLGHKED